MGSRPPHTKLDDQCGPHDSTCLLTNDSLVNVHKCPLFKVGPDKPRAISTETDRCSPISEPRCINIKVKPNTSFLGSSPEIRDRESPCDPCLNFEPPVFPRVWSKCHTLCSS